MRAQTYLACTWQPDNTQRNTWRFEFLSALHYWIHFNTIPCCPTCQWSCTSCRLPTVNRHAHCSNHCHRSLNSIVAFLPHRVTPTHHRHHSIALYRVLCPPLLVVLSATWLPCVVCFVPLSSLWHLHPSSCGFFCRLIALSCLPSINDRAVWDMCEEREGRGGCGPKCLYWIMRRGLQGQSWGKNAFCPRNALRIPQKSPRSKVGRGCGVWQCRIVTSPPGDPLGIPWWGKRF